MVNNLEPWPEGRRGSVRIRMMGDLPETAFESAEVANHGGPIGTGSSLPPGGDSSPWHSMGGAPVFVPPHKSGREARPDPFDDRVRRCEGDFRSRRVLVCVLPLSFGMRVYL